MPDVAKLGYVALRTPDVERLAAYYADVLDFADAGRDDGTAFLATDLDHHCVAISGGTAGTVHLGFQIRGSLDEAAAALPGAERLSDPAPGIPALLRLEDPEGNTLDLYAEIEHRSRPTGSTRPQKLGHVCYFVRDPRRTAGFYQDTLAFRWADSIGDFFVFLRCNSDHHAVNLLKSAEPRRIHHVAYEMRNVPHLHTALDTLGRTEHKVVWGPGRHGPGHNVFTYHHDPDGTVVELFTELDLMLDEELGYYEPRPWHLDTPQRPKVWKPDRSVSNSWGPGPPEGFPR